MSLPPPTTAATLAWVLRGRRDFVPISRAFLQQRQRGGGPGPLARFVRSRRRRALDLYLLMHAIASSPPYDVALPISSWISALALPDTESSRVSVSANLSWLESERLVRAERRSGRRVFFLLADDGTGAPYRHGPGRGAGLDYFKLPYVYWHQGWHFRLTLPGLAVLLIALSLPDGFLLPQHQGADWYGMSRDTVKRGIQQLRTLDLLEFRTFTKRATGSPTGLSADRRYRLREPFATRDRRPALRPTPRG